MANVDEARQANMGSGAGGNKQSDWQKQLELLSTMALARGADPSTMAGFALGRWLSNYFGRGQNKKDSAIAASLDSNSNMGPSVATDSSRDNAATGAATDRATTASNTNNQYDFASALNAMGQQGASDVLGGTPGAIGFNTTTNKLEYIPLTSGLMLNLDGVNLNGDR